MPTKPIIIGHKANTLRAIYRYLKLRVPVLEFDVKKKNGKLVLMHGMAQEPASFAESLLLELHYILCSGDGLVKHITLEEALDTINGKAGVWLDIKERGIEGDIVKVLDKVNFKGPVYASSKYHIVIRNLKKLRPDIVCAVSLQEQPIDPLTPVKIADADMISIEHTYVDRDFIEVLHKNNIKITVWTVNCAEVAEKLINLGVDAIVTDRPDVILKVLGKPVPKFNLTLFSSLLLLLMNVFILAYYFHGVNDFMNVISYYNLCEELP